MPTTGETRFTALASGEIDVLARNSTWTFSRDVDLKFTFVGVNYYDGQGFMVSKDLGVTSAIELDGATVCIQTGTTTELNLADWFKANSITYQPVPIQTNAEADQQFLGRRLRRLHHRRLAASPPAAPPTRTRTTGSSCPRSSPRSRSAAGAPGRRPVGRHRALDAERADRRRGVRRHRRQRRRDGDHLARTRRSSGCSAPRATSAPCSASTRTGRSARSRPTATTARSSPPTSARARPRNIARGLNAPVDRRRADLLAAVPLIPARGPGARRARRTRRGRRDRHRRRPRPDAQPRG